MKATIMLRRAAVAAGLTALLAASACGTAGPQGSGAGSGAASAWILSGVTEKAFTDSFDAWNTAHPDKQFAVQSFANDPYKQKIRTAVGAADAPTLIYGWGGGVLSSYIDAGSVDDLSDLVADPAVANRFLPSIAEVGQVDGKTYAVPNNGVKPVMIYYNKDLFAQIGAQPPATWGELMALVPRFQAAGIAPFTVAGQPKWPLLPWFSYLVDRVGGPEVMAAAVADEPGAWSDPAVLRATEMIQDLVDAGGFVKGFASIATDSGADTALLYTGKAAMSLGLPATYQTVQTSAPDFLAAGKLGYIPFPAVEGGTGDPANVVGNPSNYWSISSAATPEEKQVARDYITDSLLNDQYVSDLLAIGNVPPVAGIEDEIAASSDPAYFTTIYDVTAKAPHFQLSLDQALSPAQGDALLTNLQQIFLGQITPQQFSDAMNATVGS